MRLFIAEKSSLARAIAEALPGPAKRSPLHITCGDDVVAWCAGHILETAPPEAYGAEFKTWRLEQLPIIPKEWKHEVTAPELLKSIKTLLKKATRVVHAGDPDREGQLLVDEVLAYLGYRGPVDRVLLRDLSPEAVRRALGVLEPNAKYRPLSESALARQRADWLFGMNMTRLYTLLGKKAGYDGVLSVGRVQTPLLGLIVQRDLAIESFVPAPYFVVHAMMATSDGASFRATWIPGKAQEDKPDSDGRLTDRGMAESLRARTGAQSGLIRELRKDRKSEPPPLTYSLADLQIDAGRRLGISAKAVLDACQSLYETHRLTTYPRSDCAYLPAAHVDQAPGVIAAIAKNAPTLVGLVGGVDLSLRSKAWNDTKVTAHHALIPTPSASPNVGLTDHEGGVYELIARRYLAQFFPAFEYLQTRVEVEVAGEIFVAKGRQIVAEGWRTVIGKGVEAIEHDSEDRHGDAEAAPLPKMANGDVVIVKEVVVEEKRTAPPKAFNDASLIQAMCSVASFVSSPNIKRILRETDGIGTPATRAAIVETLFERGYVTRNKKTIVSTATGRALIKSLPAVATTPDMTALWEAALRAIEEGVQSLEAFLDCVISQLGILVTEGKAMGSILVPAAVRDAKAAAPPRGVKAKRGAVRSSRGGAP